MTPKIVLLSLSLDLKRICTAIQRNSSADVKFNSEANGWLGLAKSTDDKNLQKLLNKIEKTLKMENNLEKAEDCLMYSFLIQNRALALEP